MVPDIIGSTLLPVDRSWNLLSDSRHAGSMPCQKITWSWLAKYVTVLIFTGLWVVTTPHVLTTWVWSSPKEIHASHNVNHIMQHWYHKWHIMIQTRKMFALQQLQPQPQHFRNNSKLHTRTHRNHCDLTKSGDVLSDATQLGPAGLPEVNFK